MMLALLLMLALEIHQVRVVTVDVIEVNHTYTVEEDTKRAIPQYDQLIGWEWEVAEARHVVRFWKWLKDTGYVERRASYWVCRFIENRLTSKGYVVGIKEIRAPVCRETWTVGDPEQEDGAQYGRKYRWAMCEAPY